MSSHNSNFTHSCC